MGFEYRTNDYRTNPAYDLDSQNESRADRIEWALAVSGDKNAESDENVRDAVYTDVSDLLASVRHFCERAGIDYDDVDGHAEAAYEGDVNEDGPPVHRDTERFPEPVPEPGPGQIFIYSDGDVKTGPPVDPSA